MIFWEFWITIILTKITKIKRNGVQQDYAKESLQELEVGIEPYESGTEIQESGSSPNRQFWKTWEDLLFQDF